MTKPKSKIDLALEQLSGLEAEPVTDVVREKLRAAIRAASNVVVARAARVVVHHGLRELCPELLTAFGRLLEDPVRRDKAALGKLAIAEALNALDHGESPPFLAGVHHVQMEPSFGPPVDVAERLRAECLRGLYRTGYPDLLLEVVRLLHDREPLPRRTAAVVLGALGGETAELLLRMKILAGDPEPDVQADCFTALIQAAPRRAIAFLLPYVQAADEVVATDAAMAISSARSPEAFEALKRLWDTSVLSTFKKRLLMPIALTRIDAAFEFLLSVVHDEQASYASLAHEAIRLYEGDSRFAEAIAALK